MLSMIMLLPRETISASKPDASAPAKHPASATRHATLLIGRISVQRCVKIVHTG